MFEISDWHQPKFDISRLKTATAGSCFAQHIGRYFKERQLPFLDVEPPPKFLSEGLQALYGYNIFSARYGNIYNTKALLQLIQRAVGSFVPKENCWPLGNGWVDPFRPTIEPKPFISPDEVGAQQKAHLEKVCNLFSSCELFIFTLGLTEGWRNKEDGAVYPVVPGTKQAGGLFDERKYEFINLSYKEVVEDLKNFYLELIKINPFCKIILTVSPVPLVATATGKHVVTATAYSKSVLRAAAGIVVEFFENIDYFPSYEIINSHVMQGSTYLSDKRRVSSFGVDMAMRIFFDSYGINLQSVESLSVNQDNRTDDPLCDEEILNAFMALQGNRNV